MPVRSRLALIKGAGTNVTALLTTIVSDALWRRHGLYGFFVEVFGRVSDGVDSEKNQTHKNKLASRVRTVLQRARVDVCQDVRVDVAA